MIFTALITFFLIIVTTYFINKRLKFNKIQKEMYSKLLSISPKLQKTISDFKKRRTTITFNFHKLIKENSSFQKLKCKWNSKEYFIENQKYISFEVSNLSGQNYVTPLKISLLNEKYEKEFLINVYSHQNNIYTIFTDDENNSDIQKFSLECIYYSKSENSLPKFIQVKNNETEKNIKIEENFEINNRRRYTIININCQTCVDVINYCSDLNIDCFNAVFDDKNNNNIFLNVRITKKKKYACLFLNKERKEIYQLTEKQKKIFIKFKEEIINKFIIPNVNKDIDYLESIESNFCDGLLDFAITNKINEDKISDFDEQKISFCDKFNSEFKDIELILKRYFETPFSERFKDEIKEKDYESTIELIYIYIGVFNKNPFYSLLHFEKLKREIEKQFLKDKNKVFSLKDKIKILFNLRSYIMKNRINEASYELVKLIDLPYYSPYFSSKLFYRNIIENLKLNSKLSLIYLQLNSGSDFDYNTNKDIYKILMIPLFLIKEHILFNEQNYFFRYFLQDGKYAYTDSYTGIYSFNEFELFQTLKPISTDENDDKAVKINFVYFHERGHKKFNGNNKMESSPKYFINNDLEVVGNKDMKTDEFIGESEEVVDYYICNNNKEKINIILKLKRGLKELKNVDLYISESLNELNDKINKIINSAKYFKGVTFLKKDHITEKNKSRKYYDYGIYSLP